MARGIDVSMQWIKAFAAACLVCSPSCVTRPTNHSFVATYDQQIPIDGYLLTANQGFVVEALNQATGVWEAIGSGQSSATPTLPAGSIVDNPDLYGYSATVRIASANQPATFCRWSVSCAEPPPPDACEFSLSAQIRVRTGEQFPITFEAGYQTCMAQEIGQGRSFVQAAIACQSDAAPALTVSYIHIC
jgi:hypothetical protein